MTSQNMALPTLLSVVTSSVSFLFPIPCASNKLRISSATQNTVYALSLVTKHDSENLHFVELRHNTARGRLRASSCDRQMKRIQHFLSGNGSVKYITVLGSSLVSPTNPVPRTSELFS